MLFIFDGGALVLLSVLRDVVKMNIKWVALTFQLICTELTNATGLRSDELIQASRAGDFFAELYRLPVELRDAIFMHTSPFDYGMLLRASRNSNIIGASDEFAFGLVRKVAEEMKTLRTTLYTDRIRLKALASCVITIVRIHFGLPVNRAGLPATYYADSLPELEKRFARLSRLLKCNLWHRACMYGLVGTQNLESVLPFMSASFIIKNIDHILAVVVGLGDHKSLGYLMQYYGFLVTKPLDGILFGLALNGTHEMLYVVQSHGIDVRPMFGSVLVHASFLGRETFIKALLPTILSFTSPFYHKVLIGDLLEDAGVSGCRGIVEHIVTQYSQLVSLSRLARSITLLIENGHLEILKLLLWDEGENCTSKLIDADILDDALISAARHNRLEILRYLLLDPDRRFGDFSESINYAFLEACRNDSVEAIQLILEQDSNNVILNQFQGFEGELLSRIVSLGHVRVLELVLRLALSDSRFAAYTISGHEALCRRVACKKGSLSIVRFLLRVDGNGNYVFPGMDPGASQNELLVLACKYNRLDIVRELLQMDMNGNLVHPTVRPDVDHNKPVRTAACCGSLQVLEFLLQKIPTCSGKMKYKFAGINPADRRQDALEVAACNGHLPVVQYLLQKIGDEYVFPEVKIPPGLLKDCADVEVVAALLEHQVSDRDTEIKLAIDVARAYHGQEDMIELLQAALEKSTVDSIAPI